MTNQLKSMFAVLALCTSFSPALAIDCAKANTASENRICASPDLLKRDATLNRVFERLGSKLSKERKSDLVGYQKFWLDHRDTECGANSSDYDCATEISNQIILLRGQPESYAGPIPNLLRIVARRSSANATLIFQAVQFENPSTPGETYWNAEIDAQYAKLNEALNDAALAGVGAQVEITSELNLVSPDFIIGEMKEHRTDLKSKLDYNRTVGKNINSKSGMPFGFYDVFKPNASEIMIELCARKPADGLAKMSQQDFAGKWATRFFDMNNWFLHRDRAVFTRSPESEICQLSNADVSLQFVSQAGFALWHSAQSVEFTLE